MGVPGALQSRPPILRYAKLPVLIPLRAYFHYKQNRQYRPSRQSYQNLQRNPGGSAPRGNSNGQKRIYFGCGSPDYFVQDSKCKPSELVDHYSNRLKSNTRLDTLLVGCIDYIVKQNSENLSLDKEMGTGPCTSYELYDVGFD